MLAWLEANQLILARLSLFSAALFLVSLILIPWMVSLIPEDYFLHRRRLPAPWREQHHLLRLLILIGKNTLGLALLVAGFLMLFLPGQGLLTILMGLWLMDYPGKYRFEKFLVTQPGIFKGLNWIRRKTKHPPLRRDH